MHIKFEAEHVHECVCTLLEAKYDIFRNLIVHLIISLFVLNGFLINFCHFCAISDLYGRN